MAPSLNAPHFSTHKIVELNIQKIIAFFTLKSNLFPFFTFSTLKINLQNPKHCFYVIFTLFWIRMKLQVEIKVVAFLIVAPPQKLVVALGATIRDNTVSNGLRYICSVRRTSRRSGMSLPSVSWLSG